MILQFSSVLRHVTEKLGQFVQKNQATPELMGTSRGRKKCSEEKFLLSGHEKKEGRLRSRSTTLIGDLSEFFANFCINSFPRTFADTQQSLTSQSRFASNTSSSSISHTRETAFFLNIRGQVDTYIFASVFFPLIQILTKPPK